MGFGQPAHPAGTWLITVGATVASTYALDATATAAGLLLVASDLLTGLDRLPALALLVASYGVWGLGLRANLRANWALLRRTATSTNALSKAAFSSPAGAAPARSGSPRRRPTSPLSWPRRRPTTAARSAPPSRPRCPRPMPSSSSPAPTSAPPPTSTPSPVRRARCSIAGPARRPDGGRWTRRWRRSRVGRCVAHSSPPPRSCCRLPRARRRQRCESARTGSCCAPGRARSTSSGSAATRCPTRPA